MSGGCRGYCALKVPRGSGEPVVGFAGLTGRPVSLFLDGFDPNLSVLRNTIMQIERRVNSLRYRLIALDNDRG